MLFKPLHRYIVRPHSENKQTWPWSGCNGLPPHPKMEPLHELVVSHLDHYRGTSYSMHDQSRTWATRHELGTFLDLDHYRGTSYSMHDQSRTWATSLDNKRKPPEVLPKPAVWERRVVNLPITTVSRARAHSPRGPLCVCPHDPTRC